MDKYTPQIRRKMMQSVKSKGTILENLVAKKLTLNGIQYRRNKKSLKGKPDFSIIKYKVVLFIDSCFWHGCEEHCRMPKSNVKFWLNKINKNKERDIIITNYYKNLNWKILRVWEHDLVGKKNETFNIIISVFQSAKGKEMRPGLNI
jgi:DNA mismatch endonuclease, patch repair protein